MSTALTHPAPGLLRPEVPAARDTVRRVLLACGVLYSLLYVVANDVIAASLTPGYSRVSQVVSELSAAHAPARPFLNALLPVSAVLLIAFGVGVWRSAAGRRSLRVTGALLVAQGITSSLWVVAPMSPRESLAGGGGAVADLLHLVMSALSVLYIFAQLGFSAAVFGRVFRIYAAITAAAILAGGTATSLLSVRLAQGEPTPWLGLVERIMLGGWLLWLAVMAVLLWRARPAAVTGRGQS